ncbi:MAG: PAS domain-containing sensor histidine kinase [Clostridiaceae bacterium]
MKYYLKKSAGRSCFVCRGDTVTEVNSCFLNLSGFSENEILGKTLMEIGGLIRVDSQICLKDITGQQCCYMFTKWHEPREVAITCENLPGGKDKAYYVKEEFNSRIEDVFPYLSRDMTYNEIGMAIFSSDGILLNANSKYLNLWGGSHIKKEDIIGKNIKEIFSGYCENYVKDVFYNMVKECRPFCKRELRFEQPDGMVSYWDITFAPVNISGKLKYVVNKTMDVTEKVSNRMLVEKQQQEIEAIIQNMSDGVFIADKENKIFLVNSGAKEFFCCPDSIRNVIDTFKDTRYFDQDGNLIDFENFMSSRVLKGERVKETRIKAQRPDGIFYYSVSGSPLYDSNGNVEKAVLCTRDITDRVNKDNLLRHQKEKLEIIVEEMSDAIFTFDKDGNLINANKSSVDNMFFLQKMLEQADFYLANGNLIPKKNVSIIQLLKCEKFSNIRVNIKINESIINVEANYTPIFDKRGNFDSGVLLIRDITDRVKNEEAQFLKTQYDMLSRMIENLEIGLLRYSYPEMKVLDMNYKVTAFMNQGHSGFNMIGDFITAEDNFKLLKLIHKAVRDNGGSYIYSLKKFAGLEDKFFKLIFQPVPGINNIAAEVIIIVIDITDEIKEKNKMQEALKVQDQIFANVSHELKTPLNAIFSTNQLMEFYLRNNSLESNREKLNRNIEIIRRNCYRFTKLINNITDLTKIDSGFFELNIRNENIIGIVRGIIKTISEYIRNKGITIDFEADTDEIMIACDPVMIERIILNLISNAIKFSDTENKICVKISDKGGLVEILIKDKGIGIDQKHLEFIFKRFHQVDKSLYRNSEGCGIGLCIVKSLVEMHGGKISVKSKVGKGSIFKIELPVRLIDQPKESRQAIILNNEAEMVNIEFSDIYNLI